MKLNHKYKHTNLRLEDFDNKKRFTQEKGEKEPDSTTLEGDGKNEFADLSCISTSTRS